MKFFNTNRTLKRIDEMIDNAIEGKNITETFDESKLSALELKFSTYLKANLLSKQQLQQEKENINSYVSDISHQTKTVMTNIMLYTQLLEEADLSEENANLLSAISRQTDKLNFLIASLVKAARLETGVVEVAPHNNAVDDLLEDVVTQAITKAKAKNIKIVLERSGQFAFFDYKWTHEAVYNILDNAIKYSISGKTINISSVSYQFFCRIDIADQGSGIAEEDINKIFQRFYRADKFSELEGLGIGLYLAREIIGKQGGYIKVSSEEGKGSVFSVFLPLKNKID